MKTSFRFLTNTLKLTTLPLIPAAMLACTSCSSNKSSEPKGASEMSEALRGPTRSVTSQSTATVLAVEPDTRRITLKEQGRTPTTYIATPDVRNFDQIRVGDLVKTTTIQSVLFSLNPPGTAPSTTQSTTLETAPRGAKPGFVKTDIVEVTVRILAIDYQHRTATLQFADGAKKTVDVGEGVDLTRVSEGQEVTARMTGSVEMQVVKP